MQVLITEPIFTHEELDETEIDTESDNESEVYDDLEMKWDYLMCNEVGEWKIRYGEEELPKEVVVMVEALLFL